ncbi:hypothetical protein EPN42_10875 [bacterium]|nr:MAG: hypothetical protein EPN42_10875 [bacterium]
MDVIQLPRALLRANLLPSQGKAIAYYALIRENPQIEYEEAARSLGLSMTSIYRLERELTTAGFLEVNRVTGPSGRRLIRRFLDPSDSRPHEAAS